MLDAEKVESLASLVSVKVNRFRKFDAENPFKIREHLKPLDWWGEVDSPLGAFRSFRVVGNLKRDNKPGVQ